MINHKTVIHMIYGTALLLFVLLAVGLSVLLESKAYIFKNNESVIEAPAEPFPVGVDPKNKQISERLMTPDYQDSSLATSIGDWWKKVTRELVGRDWYQNLASPISRVFVIWPGERKEEVAEHIGGILRWSSEERQYFLELVSNADPTLSEGKFYPGEYVVHRYATPEDVASLLAEEFNTNILERYTPAVEERVPLEQALIIASLLEREASDFENMREVSGVIWNRLFIDMPLQLDATLQYARGSQASEREWWPVPMPRDKYIDSPYNTYAEIGLPPTAIANPSQEAVIAALNPVPTECLFYFHDARGNYFCSETYQEHIQGLRASYGRGK